MTAPEPHRDLTAFDLLLGELSAVMPHEHLERVRVVFASWAGQRVRVPRSGEWLMDAATTAARRMLATGTPTPVARDRLIGMGVGKTTAYKILNKVREEMRHARTA